MLTIGKTRIAISAVAPAGAREPVLPAGPRPRPRGYAYLVLGVAGCAAMLALRSKHGPGMSEPAKVPALFDTSAAACPEDAERADALAEDRLSLAVAKEERSPFHPEDGVAAVPSTSPPKTSSFRASGDATDADEAAAEADRLKREMTDEFRFHRVRLQRTIALEQWASAALTRRACFSRF